MAKKRTSSRAKKRGGNPSVKLQPLNRDSYRNKDPKPFTNPIQRHRLQPILNRPTIEHQLIPNEQTPGISIGNLQRNGLLPSMKHIPKNQITGISDRNLQRNGLLLPISRRSNSTQITKEKLKSLEKKIGNKSQDYHPVRNVQLGYVDNITTTVPNVPNKDKFNPTHVPVESSQRVPTINRPRLQAPSQVEKKIGNNSQDYPLGRNFQIGSVDNTTITTIPNVPNKDKFNPTHVPVDGSQGVFPDVINRPRLQLSSQVDPGLPSVQNPEKHSRSRTQSKKSSSSAKRQSTSSTKGYYPFAPAYESVYPGQRGYKPNYTKDKKPRYAQGLKSMIPYTKYWFELMKQQYPQGLNEDNLQKVLHKPEYNGINKIKKPNNFTGRSPTHIDNQIIPKTVKETKKKVNSEPIGNIKTNGVRRQVQSFNAMYTNIKQEKRQPKLAWISEKTPNHSDIEINPKNVQQMKRKVKSEPIGDVKTNGERSHSMYTNMEQRQRKLAWISEKK